MSVVVRTQTKFQYWLYNTYTLRCIKSAAFTFAIALANVNQF